MNAVTCSHTALGHRTSIEIQSVEKSNSQNEVKHWWFRKCAPNQPYYNSGRIAECFCNVSMLIVIPHFSQSFPEERFKRAEKTLIRMCQKHS